MTHRLIHEDGGLHCYSCGAFFANPRGDEMDDETTRADIAAMLATADAVPCGGSATDHPGYYLGLDATGTPIVETCAVHPYADCAP